MAPTTKKYPYRHRWPKIHEQTHVRGMGSTAAGDLQDALASQNASGWRARVKGRRQNPSLHYRSAAANPNSVGVPNMS
jgi:hypothetical protein